MELQQPCRGPLGRLPNFWRSSATPSDRQVCGCSPPSSSPRSSCSMVPSSASICVDSVHPNRVVTRSLAVGGHPLVIAPVVRSMPSGNICAGGMSDGKAWVHPFWVIRRSEVGGGAPCRTSHCHHHLRCRRRSPRGACGTTMSRCLAVLTVRPSTRGKSSCCIAPCCGWRSPEVSAVGLGCLRLRQRTVSGR